MIPAPTWTPSSAEYHSSPGWSSSMLSTFRRSPRLAFEIFVEESRPRSTPTEAMRIGSIVDICLLEQDRDRRFDQLHVVETARTDSHGDVQRAREKYPHRAVVCRSDAAKADPIIEAVENPRTPAAEAARQLLIDMPGRHQYAHRWTEGELDLRLMVDRLVEIDGRPTVVELKKTIRPSPGGFARECERLQYVLRAALYSRGLTPVLGEQPGLLFVAIGADPPHEVGVYPADGDWFAEAGVELEELLNRLRRCLAGDRPWCHDWEAPVGSFPVLRRPWGSRPPTGPGVSVDAADSF